MTARDGLNIGQFVNQTSDGRSHKRTALKPGRCSEARQHSSRTRSRAISTQRGQTIRISNFGCGWWRIGHHVMALRVYLLRTDER